MKEFNVFILCLLVWFLFQIFTSKSNPCSNFSDNEKHYLCTSDEAKGLE